MGWYSRVIDGVQEEKLWRAKDTNTSEFWDPIFNDPKFDEACKNKYRLSAGSRIAEGADVEEHYEDDIDLDD